MKKIRDICIIMATISITFFVGNFVVNKITEVGKNYYEYKYQANYWHDEYTELIKKSNEHFETFKLNSEIGIYFMINFPKLYDKAEYYATNEN